MTKNILISIALAGGLSAGAINVSAQPVDVLKNEAGVTLPAGTFTPAERPASPIQVQGNILPLDHVITLPDLIDVGPVPEVRPLPDFQIDANHAFDGSVPVRPDVTVSPLDPTQLNVVEIGAPTRILWTGGVPPEPFTPVMTDAGVVIAEADVTSIPIRPGAVTAAPEGVVTLSVVQAFDVQRSAELTARAAALEQLRTAAPEQRAEMIAVMSATQITQAAEQRELARELRTELRALREERKGN